MDCIIPGHSIKPFCASIGCLSRIGKDLYIDFDPIGGLRIRALNDSKSVFGNFQYEPAFFTRCASITIDAAREKPSKRRKGRKGSDDDDDDDDDFSEQWTVRIAMKALAAVVRARKDVSQLHIWTVGDHLAFEYQVERVESSAPVKVTHKVGYAPCGAMAAVAQTEGASELMVQPNVLSTMLDPLKRSSEIAILINDHRRMISGVTFQHDDLPEEGSSSSNLARARQASLKTETSVSYDELVDVHYVGHANDVTFSMTQGIPPPSDMKEQVVLVFSLKEFKAFLQYCSNAFVNQELQASIQFFWGGKPMVVKTLGENFNAELIMATLDHQLLKSDMKVSSSIPGPGESNSGRPETHAAAAAVAAS